MQEAISVNHLSKTFKEVKAVDDLSFGVPAGQVYGFLGQNGAGKSTTIRMLLTLAAPDEGEIEIFGMDIKKNRREILRRTGAVIERPDLYKYLTAYENLRIFSAISGTRVSTQRIKEQLAMVGLADRAHSKVKTYSQGMRQRLGLAIALVHDPELIVLDEPTNGLDPQGIADIRNLVLHLSRDLGKTVFVSSHLLKEVELIADSMLIIDKGRKVAEGKVQELLDPAETLLELKTTDNERACAILEESPRSSLVVENKEGVILLKLHRDQVPGIIREMVELGIEPVSFSPKNSLEDHFLSLIAGHEQHDASTD